MFFAFHEFFIYTTGKIYAKILMLNIGRKGAL